jgi:hypothetical protein
MHPHLQGMIADRVRDRLTRYSRAGVKDRYAKDASGHEHKGKGPGGGQFTSGEGGIGGEAPSAAKSGETSQKSGDAASKAVPDLGADKQPKTSPPPGLVYNPDPAHGKAARVGVPGHAVPPPPSMEEHQLPNLTPEERAVEKQFAKMFEADPDGVADRMIDAMAKGMGDGPNIFATDEAKGLFEQWRGSKVTGPDGKSDLSPETKAFRSKYNTALHQTANAIAKRAFVRYLDNVVMKLPIEQRQVLATAGGVAAGKGYAIANVSEVNAISKKAAATWDSAGEQNSTELPWLAEECRKRGINLTAVYVHANPHETWENPQRGVVERAGKKGRMVDARAFADSYTHGARNFAAFHEQYGKDPFVHIAILDNTAAVPSELKEIPSDALRLDSEQLYARCLDSLDKAQVPPAVKEGGAAGVRIWGPPSTDGNSQKSDG